MSDQVSVLWRDIVEWLRMNAPVTAAQIRPPASDALIAQEEAQVGRALPTDLRMWWQQADGVVQPEMALLIPNGWAPLSCHEALEFRAGCLEIAGSGSRLEGEQIDEAGDQQAFDFHELFLPIAANLCGGYLCADLRDGPLHGCIGDWDHVGAWDNAIYWESMTDMLTDLRRALIDDRPALAAHSVRRRQRFAGYNIDTPVGRAIVTEEGEVEWPDEDHFHR